MKKRLIPTLILIAYIVVLVKVMVFKVVPTITSGQVTLNFGGTNGSNPANFLPFATIIPYLLGTNGFSIAFLNLVGNIAFLVPIGFLFCLVHGGMTWKKSLVLGIAAGLSIEVLQTVLRVGIFDIDDVILNALGVVIGYLTFKFLTKWVRERKYAHILIAAILVIVASAGAFYVIYPHGQEQVSPGIGAGGRLHSPGKEKETAVPKSGDLCGGTGGTGQIVGMRKNIITIKGANGIAQDINLSDRTEIKNSAGSILESNLKIGQHVTVVIMGEGKNASTVLVCNTTGSKTH